MPEISDIEVDQAVAAYSMDRALYCSLSDKLQDLFKNLLNKAGIKYHSIEGRAKDVESFKEKITRSGKSYNDPLKQIHDLCGIRVIVYYNDDVEKVKSILKNEFSVNLKESGDRGSELQPNEFGYLSTHLVLKLTKTRSSLPEWANHRDHWIEVQIRTVLQHGWAAISHLLQYKREEDVPDHLKRRLFRIAGLLELADEEFQSIVVMQQQYIRKITSTISKEKSHIKVDADSLNAYLTTSKAIAKLVDIAEAAGFTIEEDSSSYGDIAYFAFTAGLSSIGEIDSCVAEAIKKSPDFLGRLWKLHYRSKRKVRWVISAAFITTLHIILLYPELFPVENLVTNCGWGEPVAIQVHKAIASS
jgi:putative GTP pyrophosphokinase